MKEEAPRTLYGGIIKTGQTSQTQSNPIKLKQTDSNQIKPACCLLTSAATPEGLVVVRLLRLIGAMASASRESRRIKPNQTESNQINCELVSQ
jgi:hypothetical protein